MKGSITKDARTTLFHALRKTGTREHKPRSTWVVDCEADTEVGTWRNSEKGQLSDAVEALGLLVQQGSYVSPFVFYEVLRRSSAKKELVVGRCIHALVLKSGYESNKLLANHIIRMYASHARLQDVLQVFSKLVAPNAYVWASFILAHAEHGHPMQAIKLYWQMRQSGVLPDNHIFVAVLKACARAADLTSGRQVHADVLRSAAEPDVFVGSCLVDMYAKCGSLDDARRVFDSLATRNVVTWTAMVAGYAQHGLGHEALTLYAAMQQEDITPADHVIFVCLLKACASVGALQEGKQLHCQIQERGLDADPVMGSSLVDMYAKCGSLDDARKVFDSLASRNVITWNAMLAGYAEHGLADEVLSLYATMQQGGITTPDSVTFMCLLNACASVRATPLGKELHSQIQEQGLDIDDVLGSCLVDMYAKCGSLTDARYVFDNLATRNVVAWNALLTGYAQHGLGHEALALYQRMQDEGISPGEITFVCLLKSCASIRTLPEGKQLHCQIQERGLETDVVIGSCLLDMYAKCGSLDDARKVFDMMPTRNVVTWNAMLAAYAEHGLAQESLTLYTAMQQESITQPDQGTFVCLLKACGSTGALHQGQQLHRQIQERGLESDLVISNSLVDMYAKCLSFEEARKVFDSMGTKDVVTWTVLLGGYVGHGLGQEALDLYKTMEKEGITPADHVTFVFLLKACASIGALHQGRQLHAQVQEEGMEGNVVMGSCLVDMYTKCRSIDDARRVFDNLATKDVVTWTAMIAGYAEHELGEEALALYDSMLQEGIWPADHVTFVCLLKACASSAALEQGRQLHARIQEVGLDSDTVLGNCLVDMYAKCGSVDDAWLVFERLPTRNVVTWNAMLAGYTEQGLGDKALDLYASMQLEGLTAADPVTFVCLLTACSSTGALSLGKDLHAQIRGRGLEADVVVGSCLVDMYAKCGSLEDARSVFDTLGSRNVVTWTAMITAYAQHGLGAKALQCFDEMRLAGVKPNEVTFLSLLSACSHGGLVDQGVAFFRSMSREHGFTPSIEHYVSMMDLFGRAGCFTRVQDLLSTMPMPPDLATWLCILAACRNHGNVELGEKAFNGAVRLQPNHPAAYVLMSQIYADAGHLHRASKVERLRKEKRAWKEPGRSWIDHQQEAQTFLVGNSHPQNSLS